VNKVIEFVVKREVIQKMFEIRFIRNRFCKLQQILCLPITIITNTLIIYKFMTAYNQHTYAVYVLNQITSTCF